MTPIDRIAQLREAFTTVLTGLSQAREAVHQMEADLLDWAEEAGDIYAYQQADEPTAPAPEPPAAAEEPETAAPVEPTPGPVEPSPEPTEAEPAVDTAPEPVSLEQVRARLSDLAAAGHTAQVQQLIQGRGAAKLSDIPESEYAALLADAEGIAA